MSKITVKEVLLACAQMLGLDDTVEYLNAPSQEKNAGETEELLRCFNIVENEVALDYLPLYAETEVETQTGAVQYACLPNAIVRVLRVCDEWGNSVPFKIFPDHIQTQSGKIKIAYTYAPESKALDGESDYTVQASARLFAYGVATEYSLAKGMFEEASVWDKKYKDAITAAYRSRPCRILRSRRWA